MKKMNIFLFVSIFSLSCIFAQTPMKPGSGDVYESIQKLNFLGTVLYIAAHPDDENTRLISYFANDTKARTAYLSLTRGDGGQNLVGPEIRELLGVIRTQELLAARRIDGGEQFFTRANDFGYSKHPDETLEIWDKDEVLKDVVAIIRKFKPDVIINRFNHRNSGSTHGHHTSSAILGVEAYQLASNKNYKTYLEKDVLWTPKRLLFNTSWWFYGSRENFEKADKSNLISLDIGTYYVSKGRSNSEIASLSRSQHQSQGFGSTGTRGSQIEYLEFLEGDFPKNGDVFEGIDTSWNRVKGGRQIGKIIDKVENEFDFTNPSKSIPDLVMVCQLIDQLEDSYWKEIKSKEIKQIITACAGLYLEAKANNASTTRNSKNSITIEAINRSDVDIKLRSVSVGILNVTENPEIQLVNNVSNKISMMIEIPEEIAYSAPYWLYTKGSLGMYDVTDKTYISKPETPRLLKANFVVEVEGYSIHLDREIIFKYNDPVKGEVYKPFEILPVVTASFREKVTIFSDEQNKKIGVKIKAGKENIGGKLQLKLPDGWKMTPDVHWFKLSQKGEEQLVEFEISPPSKQSEGYISPVITIGNEIFTDELVEIDYDYIPFQSIIMPSEAKVVRLNIQKKGQIIGYIHGAGDVVPTSLRQIGYTVVELKEDDISPDKLANFDAIIMGIRAFNTNDRTKFYQKHLHSYVENGGTLVAQYNTNRRLKVEEVAPYPLKLSRDRVTDENSEVRIINPTHEILNYPNKITSEDFDGWVQERGLYFPNEWDPNFEAIISINDKNEAPKDGSLLVAKYGKGHFIYTGLSFFRELPAGVPGAYKLFANIISVGKNKVEKPIKD